MKNKQNKNTNQEKPKKVRIGGDPFVDILE